MLGGIGGYIIGEARLGIGAPSPKRSMSGNDLGAVDRFFALIEPLVLTSKCLGRVCKSCLMDSAPTWR